MGDFNQSVDHSQVLGPGVLHSLVASLRHYHIDADLAPVSDTDGIHAAVQDDGSEQVIETGFTNPDVPRNVTATAGGTAGDIKAVQVTVEGTDFDGLPISETLPAFTVNTAGSVVGSKAFKTITKVTIPAHDGTGATTAIGFGAKLGLPDRLERNTVLKAFLDDALEGTAPTVTVDPDAVCNNTFQLNTTLNGDAVDLYYMAG
jgi:hypothetical protein